ncbi:MAG TPA: hypothetical protein VK177_01400 [Flavobacteriales bacterium]|nr:hypothetical protein [Flavobacteriales bacterium]
MKGLQLSFFRLLKYLLVAFVAAELALRFIWGLGSLPLYTENEFYEYMYAPNQDLYRFGNHICTNSLGMRSPELNKKDKIRVLKIGDSVINGGAHVDQDNLSSTLLATQLTNDLKEQIGVYNISAQSWGPDNAFAYIKSQGDFDAKIFMLVFSSHDLHDNMHFKNVVGNHMAWPSSQPLCALTDAWTRYAWPKIKGIFGSKEQEYDYLYDFDDSKLNTGWKNFFTYCSEKKIKLLVYVHATKTEVENKSYDKYGKQLLAMLDSNKIEYLEGKNHIHDLTAYRDEIHLNTMGHKLLTKALFPVLRKAIKELETH